MLAIKHGQNANTPYLEDLRASHLQKESLDAVPLFVPTYKLRTLTTGQRWSELIYC